MRLELRGHHVDVTPGLRRSVEAKLSKLERLLNHRAVSAQAILTIERHRRVADITLHASGERFLHGVGDSASWETSLAQAIAKISHQAQKLKTQQKEKRHNLKAPPPPESPEPVSKGAKSAKPAAGPGAKRTRPRGLRVVRTVRDALKTMSVEEAARHVEDGADHVIVFRNDASRSVCVLYRRADGELALVEPEA
jgi:ribosome hibernation promoting factor